MNFQEAYQRYLRLIGDHFSYYAWSQSRFNEWLYKHTDNWPITEDQVIKAYYEWCDELEVHK